MAIPPRSIRKPEKHRDRKAANYQKNLEKLCMMCYRQILEKYGIRSKEPH